MKATPDRAAIFHNSRGPTSLKRIVTSIVSKWPVKFAAVPVRANLPRVPFRFSQSGDDSLVFSALSLVFFVGEGVWQATKKLSTAATDPNRGTVMTSRAVPFVRFVLPFFSPFVFIRLSAFYHTPCFPLSLFFFFFS